MMVVSRSNTQELRLGQAKYLLEQSVYNATPVKIARLIDVLDMGNGHVYLAQVDESVVGLIAAIRTSDGPFEIKALFVAEAFRQTGVGRELVAKLISDNEDPVIQAETDDDAAGFYHSLGFRIHSLGEKYPGITRYLCTYDHLAWEARPYDGIISSMRDAGIQCWVSGGHAIDLHIGTQTREHLDLDISILRKDQGKLRELLSDWEIYHTLAPGLRYWRDGRFLSTIPNLWVRKNQDSPWSFEVMFQESDEDTWIYRRNRSVRRSVGDIGLESSSGIPYLRPEIGLLYKGGGTSYREKDVADLMAVLPFLSEGEKQWLLDSLRKEFPSGHDWIDLLNDGESREQRHRLT